MQLIVGLGNPGSRYEKTRHNAGFLLLDYFASQHKLSFSVSKSDYYKSEGSIGSSDFFLMKPTTFMNLSGQAVKDLFTRIPELSTDNLLVLYDDIHIPFGDIRIKRNGGDGGHNGIKSIIYELGRNDFARLRIGIGKDFENGRQIDHVLSKFETEEIKTLEKTFQFGQLLIDEFIVNGITGCLNKYSTHKKSSIISSNLNN